MYLDGSVANLRKIIFQYSIDVYALLIYRRVLHRALVDYDNSVKDHCTAHSCCSNVLVDEQDASVRWIGANVRLAPRLVNNAQLHTDASESVCAQTVRGKPRVNKECVC